MAYGKTLRLLRWILSWSVMISGISPSYSTATGSGTESLLAQTLQVWSLINVARSVAKQDQLAFHDALFTATLELYGQLWCTVQHASEPVDIAIVDQALHGLTRSHAGLYRDCADAALLGTPRLMRSISTLWEGYKERIAYTPDQEDAIGMLIDRIL